MLAVRAGLGTHPCVVSCWVDQAGHNGVSLFVPRRSLREKENSGKVISIETGSLHKPYSTCISSGCWRGSRRNASRSAPISVVLRFPRRRRLRSVLPGNNSLGFFRGEGRSHVSNRAPSIKIGPRYSYRFVRVFRVTSPSVIGVFCCSGIAYRTG